jgi:hypothetical protein
VPWCERCDRFLNPNTVNPDGTCPSCGRPVEPAAGSTDSPADENETFKAPWHFWVMIASAVVYLGWRFIEGIVWAIRQAL